MSVTIEPETLAQWAARVAPTITDQWWEVDHPDRPTCWLGGRLYTVGEQRALLGTLGEPERRGS